ncbi:MAG: adenine deaminase C-terminal domain-containing protein [Desulfurococcaceae archaeon]
MACSNLIRNPDYKIIKGLISVSRGLEKADILVKNVKLVNVFTGEILEPVTIAISRGLIATTTRSIETDRFTGPNTLVIDGNGELYAVPGFIDAHIHIESSFLNPLEFSKLATLHGTTTVVADPHEIANVCGLECLEWFINASRNLPMKILVQVPCCVPPVPEELDNPGATVPLDTVKKLLSSREYFGLGELMNYSAVVEGDEGYLETSLFTIKLGSRVYGHIPSIDETHLNTYALSYASSCHEVTTLEEALEKLRLGYYVMLRTGGAWRNADEALPLLRLARVNMSRLMLVVDDTTVSHLVELGYMDFVVRNAIELGLDPIEAIQLVTINPAQYLGLDSFVGSIAPGRIADIVLVDDLESMRIRRVISCGEIYDEDRVGEVYGRVNIVPAVTRVMEISNLTSWRQLVLSINDGSYVRVRVIEVTPGTPVSKEKEAVLPVVDNYVASSPSEDVIHVASIDRYRGGRYIGVGFLKGLNLVKGAVAQTIAHDTHNVLVYGDNPYDMFTAVQALKELEGGIVVASSGRVLAKLGLPIAGLMSTKSYSEVYGEFNEVARAIKALGFTGDIHSFILTTSVVSLPVIPEIRITPKGLVNVTENIIVPPLKEVLG